jgi:hypothetical protein
MYPVIAEKLILTKMRVANRRRFALSSQLFPRQTDTLYGLVTGRRGPQVDAGFRAVEEARASPLSSL